ncbi:MAG: hypothetical protein ABEJ76_09420 [Halanaeroarchaeum sp.]
MAGDPSIGDRLSAFGWVNVGTVLAFGLLLVWYLVASEPWLISLAAAAVLLGFLADRR